MVAEAIKVNESEKGGGSSQLTLGENFWLENRVNSQGYSRRAEGQRRTQEVTSGTCPKGHEQGLLRPGKEAASGPRGRDFPSYEDRSQTTWSLASGPQWPSHRPEMLKLAGDHLLLTLPVRDLQQILHRPQSSKTKVTRRPDF